ncbi:fibronectin type III domain-containing protein [Streptomyces filamentosus]|uniref:PA14 domain-containing protein n=1 Tax=Streptomyces filamentosus TaxID=67294 RepID=A0A919BJA7_STRFL|nr:PA14 domain-containing protein [Streptomyces filamentosus]KAA6218445.1 hypothetical protein CP979_17135 [Streptomyces filamentosus]GHF94814.1 hypothetical protein GCM10017667_26190 [Streptomyces filamentosus]
MITRPRPGALAVTAALVASGLLSAATPAAAAVTCASPQWKAEYYANTTLTGTPKLTTCDSAIAENYGYGDPAGVTLPKDNFSVRWTLTRDFGSGGPFTFTAEAQDGIRVSLDGIRKIDLWKNVSVTQKKTVNLTVPSGRHTIVVHYATWTGAANVKVSYAPVTSATVDKTRPLAPGAPNAWYDWADSARTYLSWPANKEMDLAGYHVYRRPSTATAWTRISGTAPVTGRTYTDQPPPTGQSYVYEVRARDKAGNESAGSADQRITSVDRTGPAAPTGLVVDTSAGTNALSWRVPASAVRYEVQAADQASGPYTVLAEVSAPSHVDLSSAPGVNRYYRVRAYDAADNPSAYSATANGDRIDRTPPPPPTGLTVHAYPGENIVYWTYSDVHDVSSSDPGSFRVYRSPGTVLDPAALTRLACADRSYTASGGRCTDRDMDQGRYYTYVVTAVDSTGNESLRSAPFTVRSGDRVAPGPVVDLRATPRADGALLTWKPPADDDIAGYSGWQGVTGENGTVAWSTCREGSADPLAMVCPGVPDGETVVYAVAAWDTSRNQLSLDGPDIAKVTAQELDVRPSVDVVDDWNLSGGMGWSDITTGAPSLSWSCFTAAACAEITGYRMSRWNAATSTYEPLHAGLLPTTGTRHTDTTALPGGTYFYTFQALRADGTVVATRVLSAVRPALV